MMAVLVVVAAAAAAALWSLYLPNLVGEVIPCCCFLLTVKASKFYATHPMDTTGGEKQQFVEMAKPLVFHTQFTSQSCKN